MDFYYFVQIFIFTMKQLQFLKVQLISSSRMALQRWLYLLANGHTLAPLDLSGALDGEALGEVAS